MTAPKTILLAEAAERLGVTVERVRVLCVQRRIPGARLVGRIWRVPVRFTITPASRGPKLGAKPER